VVQVICARYANVTATQTPKQTATQQLCQSSSHTNTLAFSLAGWFLGRIECTRCRLLLPMCVRCPSVHLSVTQLSSASLCSSRSVQPLSNHFGLLSSFLISGPSHCYAFIRASCQLCPADATGRLIALILHLWQSLVKHWATQLQPRPAKTGFCCVFHLVTQLLSVALQLIVCKASSLKWSTQCRICIFGGPGPDPAYLPFSQRAPPFIQGIFLLSRIILNEIPYAVESRVLWIFCLKWTCGAPLRNCTAVTESVKLQLTIRPTVITTLNGTNYRTVTVNDVAHGLLN